MGMTKQQMELEIKRLRAEVDQLKRPKSVAKVIQQGSEAKACLALLAGGFTSSAATFSVDNVTPLNGKSPVANSSETITVTNRYGWDTGADNAKIEIVYDPETETWIPRQMECPA